MRLGAITVFGQLVKSPVRGEREGARAKMKDETFAIIGRVPGRRGSLWLDEVHLDGWYSGRKIADWMFDYYKKEYPELELFLVKLEAGEFRGDADIRKWPHLAYFLKMMQFLRYKSADRAQQCRLMRILRKLSRISTSCAEKSR
jgi:hypothetical protein